MKVVSRVEDVINPSIVERGSIICTAGADVTSQVLLRSLAADPVNFVTENGAVNPQGLNIAEHAVSISHLAASEHQKKLLKYLYESKEYHEPPEAFGKLSLRALHFMRILLLPFFPIFSENY